MACESPFCSTITRTVVRILNFKPIKVPIRSAHLLSSTSDAISGRRFVLAMVSPVAR
jgi:hypothetical protein